MREKRTGVSTFCDSSVGGSWKENGDGRVVQTFLISPLAEASEV